MPVVAHHHDLPFLAVLGHTSVYRSSLSLVVDARAALEDLIFGVFGLLDESL